MSEAHAHLLLAIQRKQSEKSNGAGASDYSLCGPPHWDRAQWEAFKTQYGHYPFGLDGQGGFVSPRTYDNAPDWVFELLGQRVPPIRMRNPQ